MLIRPVFLNHGIMRGQDLKNDVIYFTHSPIHTTRSRVRQKWCLNRVKIYCKMSIIVCLHNPSAQNPTMTSNPRPTFAALLVLTVAPCIARDSDIGPPMVDHPHLHLCTLLHPPHHHHLCHIIQT